MAKQIHPEDLVECPYDPVHMIRAKRMQYHLLKCRQNHNCYDMARCPFNASHEVYKAELRYHMGMCEDRHKVQARLIQEFQDSSEMTGCVEIPGYTALHIAGDSWEHEILRGTPADTVDTSRVKEDPKNMVVRLSEAEVQGLNLRQRRALYLKKKKEIEARAQKDKSSTSGSSAGLPAPRQLSQSLALHQQQIQQQQQPDIYQFMHKAPGGVGRGMPRAAPLRGPGLAASAGGPKPGARPPPLSASSAGQAVQQGPSNAGDSNDNAVMSGLIRQTQCLVLGAGCSSPAVEAIRPLGAAAGLQRPGLVPGRGAEIPVGGYAQRVWGPPSFSTIVAGQRSTNAASPYNQPTSQPPTAARAQQIDAFGRGSRVKWPNAAPGTSFSVWSPQQQVRGPWLDAGIDSESDSVYEDALSQPVQVDYGYSGGYSSMLTSGGNQYLAGSWAEDVERAYPLGGSSESGSVTTSNSDSECQDAGSMGMPALRKGCCTLQVPQTDIELPLHHEPLCPDLTSEAIMQWQKKSEQTGVHRGRERVAA